MYRSLLFTLFALFSLAWHAQAFAFDALITAESGSTCLVSKHSSNTWTARLLCTPRADLALTPRLVQKLESSSVTDGLDNNTEEPLTPLSMQLKVMHIVALFQPRVEHLSTLQLAARCTDCFFIRPPPSPPHFLFIS